MALPTTPRQTPDGVRLDDGFPMFFAFANAPDLAVWEKEGQPPGIDGGDPVQTTTFHNTIWRTMAARQLKTLTPMTWKVAYSPASYDTLVAQTNVEQAITIHFPDDSTLDFYGFLQKLDPQTVKEGEQPEANMTLCPTNTDPVTREEVAPNYKTASGTD